MVGEGVGLLLLTHTCLNGDGMDDGSRWIRTGGDDVDSLGSPFPDHWRNGHASGFSRKISVDVDRLVVDYHGVFCVGVLGVQLKFSIRRSKSPRLGNLGLE